MADRRMFTKKVTDDDNFMQLSSSAQALYLHLSMSADDDGFCNQVSLSMFKSHASVQDLQALLEKRYIYQFDNGVIVIKHWRMANALRKDRYTPTAFQEELAKLGVKDNGSYTWLPDGCQTVAKRLPQVSIVEDSIDKDISIKKTKAKESPVSDYDFSFDAEKAWNDTFAIYPKTKASAVAKQVWMNKLLEVIPQNQKDMAIIIYKAVKMYVADYDERNPEDVKNHQYIPKFDKWLTEDCDYWISQVEKGEK